MELKKECNKYYFLHKPWIKEIILDALNDNTSAINNMISNETIIAQVHSMKRLNNKQKKMAVQSSKNNISLDKSSPDKGTSTPKDDNSKSKSIAPRHSVYGYNHELILSDSLNSIIAYVTPSVKEKFTENTMLRLQSISVQFEKDKAYLIISKYMERLNNTSDG